MTTNSDRERALEKVRRLLAMANDGRGNMQEAETAARQAAALMAKFNIESAEAQLKDLCSDEPDLDQALVCPNYYGGEVRTKTLPVWVGIIAVGVGIVTQTKVDGYRKDGYGVARFSGYRTDVVFAEWLFQLLCGAVYRESTTTRYDRAGRGDFRHAASVAIQRRLAALRKEQDAALTRASSSTALVVVDKKQQVINEAFGEMKTRKMSRQVHDAGARSAGSEFGQQINIPAGARPLNGSSAHRQLSA